jgi:hypothetical protein
MGIVIIPVYFYLKTNGIINDFLSQVIYGGASRGFANNLKQTAKQFFVVINRNYSFLPLVAGIFLCIINYRKKYFAFFAGYTISSILMVLFLSFSGGDSHYNLVLIPLFVPVLAFFVQIINTTFSNIKFRKTILIIFLCVVFSEGLLKYIDDIIEIFTNNSGSELRAAGKLIDDNTDPDDKIISLDSSYIYPFTKRYAVSKYTHQASSIAPLAGAREEFLSDVLTRKPAIIVIFDDDNGHYDYLPKWYTSIYTLMANEYELLSDKNMFYIFRKKPY